MLSESKASATGADETQALPALSDITAAVLIQCGNDIGKARDLLLTTVRKELPEVYRKRQEEAMLFWAEETLRGARTDLRDRISGYGTNQPPEARQPLGVASLKAFAFSWLNWPVLPGVLMRDATRSDLRAAAAVYLRDAEIYTRRGQWLEAVAAKLPNDSATVAKALKESAIAQLAVKFGVSKE